MRKEDERGREGRTLTPRDPANDRRLNASWRVRREGVEGRVSTSSRARLLPARLILQSLVALLVIMIFVLAIVGMALGCFCTEDDTPTCETS